MNDTELAWCAGFFDGEGYVGYQRQVPKKCTRFQRAITVGISQKIGNEEVLYRFKNAVGVGEIYPGKAYHTKPMARFQSTKFEDVKKIFELLKPWLMSEKTKDFEKAISDYENHIFSKHQESAITPIRGPKCPECRSVWNQVACNSCGYVN